LSKEELEKIPFTFYYSFKCDESECNGHSLMCTDWELSQSYRKWRDEGQDWELKLRQKYETFMASRDLHFYVGTVASHPANWIIIGLFYPPIVAQGNLFSP